MFLRMLCCVVAVLNAARPQGIDDRSLLLPNPVNLSGIVKDVQGKPLGDVRVNHTGLVNRIVQTDAEGRFAIFTRAPAIVFRKPGFSSRYFRVERDAAVEIRLESLTGSLKVCPSSANCLSLKDFMSELCFPKSRDITITAQRNDIDYAHREFVIRSSRGTKGFQHAAGPMWGFGIPFDEDVWSSVEYSETVYSDSEGFSIIDARGKSSNGECWRVLKRAFETAYYREVSVQEASLLDKVLDGVCLRLKRPR